MAEFRMPSLGADMEAGTLVEWRVRPGDAVKRGDVVAIVETDKGNIDVEVWQEGVIDRLEVAPNSTVPVGTVLATLRPSAAAPPAPAAAAQPPGAPVAAPTGPSRGEPPRPRASPAARQLARELGVNLQMVRGTGPDGAITRSDIEARAGRQPIEPKPVARPSLEAPRAGMRRAIALAMARSKREIPHYYVAEHVDLSRALAWLQTENLKLPLRERILPVVVPLKAIALALREFPELNGTWRDGDFTPSSAIHIGFAISLRDGGLIAPALHDVDRKSLRELMQNLGDLILRARSGGLRSSELSDPTITLTSLGEQGTDAVYGIIYPPQVAIVGLGRIRERPWAENGLLGVRSVATVTLAADHRASDGHRGARFLARVAELIAMPEKL